MFGSLSATVSVESLRRHGEPISGRVQKNTPSYPKDISETLMKVFLVAGARIDLVNFVPIDQ